MGVNFSPDIESSDISVGALISCGQLTFDWAESYDTKNWEQLRRILAPTFTADYTEVLGPEELWVDITADEFIRRMRKVLGDPLMANQHLLGPPRWTVISDSEILASYQIRAAHQRFESEEKDVVKAECNRHGKIVHHYSLIDGKWKLSGLKPYTYWSEPGFRKILGLED